jgi:mono/diheme cytochrome c family protein
VRAALLLASLLLAAPAAAQNRTASDGVYAEAQAERGRAIYQSHCVICHGPDMTGGPGSPPIVGRAFMIGWRSESVGALLDHLRTTMPTGQAGALTDQEYADVLSVILQTNGYPASADGTELATDPVELMDVTMGAPPE